MDIFCETMKLNALLHNHVSKVDKGQIIFIKCFPANTYIGYDYTVVLLSKQQTLDKLAMHFDKKRVECVKNSISKQTVKNQGPVAVLLCKDITKCSGGKISSKYKMISWVSSCTWIA